jgi:hypothetical protein
MCSCSIDDTEWNVVNNSLPPKLKKTEAAVEESIYIILINNRPYGYYYSEDETTEQIKQAQEHVMSRHFFDFKKNYYWNNLPAEDDTIVKMKLVSVIKDSFVRYDSVEDSIEIIISRLLPLRKE